tara:strand:- start:33 stop:395 length:363 start_codon:yes stop_codon:yes gene_type:complete
MAHFAQLDENNKVIQVIVVKNDILLDSEGNEQESLGVTFCQSLYGSDTNWKQTSYNGNFRGRMAGVGSTYDNVKNIFISPQPFPSWTLNDNNIWIPPVDYPEDDSQRVIWNETDQKWDEA